MTKHNSRATHAVEEIIGVNYGVIISCRCGWTHHATPGSEKGDEFDARKAARIAMKRHKSESGHGQ